MRDQRFNCFSILVLMATIGIAACSTSFYSSQSIASSADKGMEVNTVSQTSTFQTHTSSINSQMNTNSSSSRSITRTTVSLRSANLRQPHQLIIRSSGRTLTGQIVLDSHVIQTLQSNPTEIDLAPYLSAGQHEVEILSSSTPATASLTIEFIAPETHVMQQTSGGSGNRSQLLLFIN